MDREWATWVKENADLCFIEVAVSPDSIIFEVDDV